TPFFIGASAYIGLLPLSSRPSPTPRSPVALAAAHRHGAHSDPSHGVSPEDGAFRSWVRVGRFTVVEACIRADCCAPGLRQRRQVEGGVVIVGAPTRRAVLPAALMRQTYNWLRVLDTAESSQVDQRVGHQLHAIMPLLDTFETEEESLEFVLPRKGALDTHP